MGLPLSDDGSKMIDSLFFLEASSRQEAEHFDVGHPFRLLGIWESVTIRRFDERTDRRGAEGAA
ncbi:MAG TPA: hypothetical protein VHX12_00965 [Acidisoma sp.]|nr:hypothetical protein [Acidisoma sp.]